MTALASRNSLQARRFRDKAHLSAGSKAARAGVRGVTLFDGGGTAGGFSSPAPVHFPSDPNSIVTVNVSTIIAPTPNTYQQTGAFVSFGGTTLASQTVEVLTQRSDLDEVLSPAMTITALTWNAGVVTCTVAAGGPTWVAGDTPIVSISGCVPEAYNGNAVLATVVTPTSFTYSTASLATDPTAATTKGVAQLSSAVELGQMATTFFAQGNSISVYVLELGNQQQASQQAPLLETWLGINPRSFYGYLLPRSCGGNSPNIVSFENLFKQYQNPEAMTYFWLTVTPATQAILDPTYKCVIQMVEAPDRHRTRQSRRPGRRVLDGRMFYNAMLFRPSNTNRIAPMAFKYLYGVTSYPTQNNGPLLRSFKDNATNYISTGAEGGIDFNMVYTGVHPRRAWTTSTGGGRIDWVQIQINLDCRTHHQWVEQRARAALLRSDRHRHAARHAGQRR